MVYFIVILRKNAQSSLKKANRAMKSTDREMGDFQKYKACDEIDEW